MSVDLSQLAEAVRKNWKDRQMVCASHFNRILREFLDALKYTFDDLLVWATQANNELSLAIAQMGLESMVEYFAKALQEPVDDFQIHGATAAESKTATWADVLAVHNSAQFLRRASTLRFFSNFPVPLEQFWYSLNTESQEALWSYIDQLRMAAQDWLKLDKQRQQTTAASFDEKTKEKIQRMSSVAETALKQGCSAEDILKRLRDESSRD